MWDEPEPSSNDIVPRMFCPLPALQYMTKHTLSGPAAKAVSRHANGDHLVGPQNSRRGPLGPRAQHGGARRRIAAHVGTKRRARTGLRLVRMTVELGQAVRFAPLRQMLPPCRMPGPRDGGVTRRSSSRGDALVARGTHALAAGAGESWSCPPTCPAGFFARSKMERLPRGNCSERCGFFRGLAEGTSFYRDGMEHTGSHQASSAQTRPGRRMFRAWPAPLLQGARPTSPAHACSGSIGFGNG